MADSTRGRVLAIQQWLAARADTPVQRLAMSWFRSYFEASHNSGCAATLYIVLSVFPLLLAVTGLLHAAGTDTTAFAARLIDHQHLTGRPAAPVRATFGSAADCELAASG